jgi:hypothetical protein
VHEKERGADVRCNRTKYNVLFAPGPRTKLVQNGGNPGLMRIAASTPGDFHNLFHIFCEDPETSQR